jgi:[methyl-Co(III) methanol-specific corrinoid protein]:coenzyme M methyltransferase
MPTVSGRKCQKADDIKIPDDFLARPACACVLEALRILRKQYPGVALIGKVFGPWTLAYHLFGVDNFLMLTIDDPPQVHEIVKRLKPLPVLFARAQIEAGCDAITLADHASGDMVSPQMYREFLWPAHRELSQQIKAPVIQHTCGNTADRLGLIANSGFAAFHFDSKVPAQKARDIVDREGRDKNGRRKIALMGNINNPAILLQGRPADVFNAVEACLRNEIEIIGPECAVPLSTPTQNLKAIVDAVRTMRES